MQPQLKVKLEEYQILFKFNPPNAPHFCGIWEREVRSIKAALQVTVGSQAVSEDVLYMTLVEIEGILNSKPLGYVSADVTDPDPITPNIPLMGRDATLPQVSYVPAGLGRRRWRHCQMLVDQFWNQFTRNYLPSLQTRQKWQKSSGNIETAQTVLVVVIVFCLSWLPHHVVHLWAEFGTFPLTQASFVFRVVAHCLAYSNSSVNPIIYAFLSENFRKAYKQVFKCQLTADSPLNDIKEIRSKVDTPPSTNCTNV
ncbi:hypothetical protein GJAV_G00019380 [Gymnothorax javanicus]|nr:hypothetical protein GJAV_G00019380 [Gymnothorax javanicus]